MNLIPLLASLIVFPAGACVVSRWPGGPRRLALAMMSVLVFWALVVLELRVGRGLGTGYLRAGIAVAGGYLAAIIAGWLLLRRWRSNESFFVPALLYPIAVLAALRYGSAALDPVADGLGLAASGPTLALAVPGASYVAFRLSYLAVEVRNGAAPFPGLATYIGFALFPPTLAVGPISPYAAFNRSLESPVPREAGRAVLRILVGAAKYLFLGGILNQFSYQGLLLDQQASAVDLLVAVPAYYLYLYCNFSGYCDMAIGVSRLLGFAVAENFDSPLLARNPKDFWNRWHITLSIWMRDLVFAPLSRFLIRRAPGQANHGVALAIAVTFVLVGIWHGRGWNFLLFGMINAAGVVSTHYYDLALKKRLGREGYRTYHANAWVRAIATVGTFAFFAVSLFFFANDLEAIEAILRAARLIS